MSNKIIIANWKMNLSIEKSLQFIRDIKPVNNTIIAAPFTFLFPMAGSVKKKKINLAAQDVSQFDHGAYTGEISAKMLKNVGCTHCLVGHSERRIYFQEDDNIINQKIHQLLKNNIRPVLCIGENQAEKRHQQTKLVLKKQLTRGLHKIKDFSKVIIAYEPVWAISTFQTGNSKKAAKAEDIAETHDFIKKIALNLYQVKNIKVLYGGTVNPQNAKAILRLKEVDGALVGGASLKASSFNSIINSI